MTQAGQGSFPLLADTVPASLCSPCTEMGGRPDGCLTGGVVGLFSKWREILGVLFSTWGLGFG